MMPTLRSATLLLTLVLCGAAQAQTLPRLAFKDGDGRDVTLADFRGHPVLLNLWATWCGACVAEMPELDRLQAKLESRGVEVIALAEESQSGAVVRSFFRRHELTHLKVYVDDGSAALRLLHVNALPTTIFIDSNGHEVWRKTGALDWSKIIDAETPKNEPEPTT